jgi:hypothetical protein
MYFNNVNTFIYSTVSTRSSVQQLIGAAEARRAHNPEDARSKRASATCLHCFLFALFAVTAFVRIRGPGSALVFVAKRASILASGQLRQVLLSRSSPQPRAQPFARLGECSLSRQHALSQALAEDGKSRNYLCIRTMPRLLDFHVGWKLSAARHGR